MDRADPGITFRRLPRIVGDLILSPSTTTPVPLDPILSLAVSVQAAPGTYAVLLGSGVSRAAQIPTGWEVILDLMRRLAAADDVHGDDIEVVAWFTQAHGEAPTYPVVLAAAAPTPAERRLVLEGYFEPSDEDRDAGRKVPTAAHRAIADLVRDGYIRIIVTTNFDRLMEQAVRAVGIEPTVIHTPEQAAGMEPVHRHTCLIVKVHGDYLDPWIKNTPEELATYDPAFNEVLSRIFEDYGVIVSGWSAESDDALRGAITAAQSRRYMMYWGAYGVPGPVAAELIADRRAQVIQTPGADALFVPLVERVQAIADVRVAPPLNAAVAAATLKRYLPDPLQRIRLQDLVRTEANRVARWIEEDATARRNEPWDIGKSVEQLERYEALTANLRALLAAGAFYGTDEHTDLWIQSVRSVAQASDVTGAPRTKLTLYPGLLALYAAALGALAAGTYRAFARIVRETKARFGEYEQSIMVYLRPTWIVSLDDQRLLPASGGAPDASLSYRVSDLLQAEMAPYLPDERDFVFQFDLMEYLFSVWREHLRETQTMGTSADPGCYSFRDLGRPYHPSEVLAPLPAQAGNWLQTSGLFPDIAAFNRASGRVNELIQRNMR